MRRALITGIGMISPLGEGREAFCNNLMEGRSAIREIEGFDTTGFDSHLGGEVRDFKAEQYLGRKTRGLNRTTRFLTAAMKLAIEDAKLCTEETNNSGVIIGTGFGNSAHAITYAQKLLREGPEEMFPLDAMDMPSNSSVNFVSVFFGIKDFARTISAGFTSSHDALGNALQLIKNGRARRVIVAAMEQLSPELFTIFYQRGLLKSSPGDTGMVLSEGGYALVVEEAEVARSRSAGILAEITGFANGFIGNSKLSEEGRLQRTSQIIKSAIQSPSIDSAEIDLVFAAANGVKDSDLIDAATLESVFGSFQPPVCRSKAQTGEAFGASGAMQASSAALSISHGRAFCPPTPDPSSPDHKNPLVMDPQKVIINGLDVAGNFSCLVLEKHKPANNI